MALLTPRAWFAIGLAVLIAALGVQTFRLNHAKADLVTVRTQVAEEKRLSKALSASLKLSEDKRAVEYSRAVEDAGVASDACAARVAAAHRSADKIRSILEKPHATDPATGCPARALIGAGELRDALQPSRP